MKACRTQWHELTHTPKYVQGWTYHRVKLDLVENLCGSCQTSLLSIHGVAHNAHLVLDQRPLQPGQGYVNVSTCALFLLAIWLAIHNIADEQHGEKGDLIYLASTAKLIRENRHLRYRLVNRPYL